MAEQALYDLGPAGRMMLMGVLLALGAAAGAQSPAQERRAAIRPPGDRHAGHGE